MIEVGCLEILIHRNPGGDELQFILHASPSSIVTLHRVPKLHRQFTVLLMQLRYIYVLILAMQVQWTILLKNIFAVTRRLHNDDANL